MNSSAVYHNYKYLKYNIQNMNVKLAEIQKCGREAKLLFCSIY